MSPNDVGFKFQPDNRVSSQSIFHFKQCANPHSRGAQRPSDFSTHTLHSHLQSFVPFSCVLRRCCSATDRLVYHIHCLEPTSETLLTLAWSRTAATRPRRGIKLCREKYLNYLQLFYNQYFMAFYICRFVTRRRPKSQPNRPNDPTRSSSERVIRSSNACSRSSLLLVLSCCS